MADNQLTAEQKSLLKQAVIQSMGDIDNIENYHELHCELCVSNVLRSGSYAWFHPEDTRKKNFQYVCGIDDYRNMAVELGYYKAEDCYEY